MTAQNREQIYTEHEALQEAFVNLVLERVQIWETLINASSITEEVRAILKDEIEQFRSQVTTNATEPYLRGDPRDVFRAFVGRLIITVDAYRHNPDIPAEKKEELNALFYNIRDDSWDFYKEVMQKYEAQLS